MVGRSCCPQYCQLMLLSHRNSKGSPFSGEALAMHRNALPLLDSFLRHQAKGNDQRIYLAGHFCVSTGILVIHEKAYLISGLGVADAIAVCLSWPTRHIQFVEITKIFWLHSVFRVIRCRNAGEG